jgi:hypothetical protein
MVTHKAFPELGGAMHVIKVEGDVYAHYFCSSYRLCTEYFGVQVLGQFTWWGPVDGNTDGAFS